MPEVHHARRAVAAEVAARAADGGVVGVQGGGQQATDVDLRVFTKDHAVGVDQPDLAVGVDAPQYLAALRVKDAINRQRAGRRLNEVNALGLADVKALPVDR